MVTKIVISPDNKKAIDFFLKLKKRKAELKAKMEADPELNRIKAALGK